MAISIDVTSEGGIVQQSECKKELKAQLWEIKGHQIVNGYWQNECLDIYVVKDYPSLNTAQTSACEDWKKAQEWKIEETQEIQNDYTGQCLVAPGDRPLGPIKTLRCEGQGNFEKWKITEVK